MSHPLILKQKHTLTITPTKPFLFDATFHKPDHFTTNDHYWEPGTRWQTWRHNGEPLGLKFENSGTIIAPKINISVFSRKPVKSDLLSSLSNEVAYRYNLHLELDPFYKAAVKSLALHKAVTRLNGMRPGHPSSLYEYLIVGVVLQNATVRRSIQMFSNLLTSYGTQLEFDGKKLWCLWNPGDLDKVSEENLRDLKVGYRAKSIKKIDEHFAEGLIDEMQLRNETAETQKEELLSIYGVGPATVWYLMFDVFHHLDVFDHISPWEQKIYSKLFFDTEVEKPKSVKQLLKVISAWKPYQHLAIHYLWEDLWWQHEKEPIDWLTPLIRA